MKGLYSGLEKPPTAGIIKSTWYARWAGRLQGNLKMATIASSGLGAYLLDS